VRILADSSVAADRKRTQVGNVVFGVDASPFLRDPELSAEIFGPATILVRCRDRQELLGVAERMEGNLTASLQATDQDLSEYWTLVVVLQQKVGRLVFNGFPTGVEVCNAMHHGGPYPATTDIRSTSVGTMAIKRFARPICYQGFPDQALPVELRNDNRRGILRLVDGKYTRDAI
jgi:NADP-dependent aldehyde dehydrogenase